MKCKHQQQGLNNHDVCIQEVVQKEEMDQLQDQTRGEPLFLFNLNYKFILGVQLVVPLILK